MKLAPLIALSFVFSLAACAPKPSDPAASMSAAAETAVVSMAAENAASKAVDDVFDVAAFAGKWTGPEGTSLTITPRDKDYKVTVQNLDGPRDFAGVTRDGGIAFTRDGKTFVIHKGDGPATGMKWLMDKKDCLVVTDGEGYCRD